MNIPKELSIYLLKNSEDRVLKAEFENSWNSYRFKSVSNNGKPLFWLNPVSRTHPNRKGKLNSIYHYHYKNKYSDVEVKNILNKNFKLSLNVNGQTHRCYSPMPIIEISCPEFDSLPYQPAISVYFSEFLKLLQDSGGELLPGGEFEGRYRIVIDSSGAYPNYRFINENSATPYQNMSIKVGEAVGTPRTRTYIPGHIYAFKNRTYFLVLARLSDYWGTKLKYSDFYRVFDSPGGSDKDHLMNTYLVVPLSYNGEEAFDFFRFLAKKKKTSYSLCEIISEIMNVDYLLNDILFYERSHYSSTRLSVIPTEKLTKKCPLAYDLGEYINISHTDDALFELMSMTRAYIDGGNKLSNLEVKKAVKDYFEFLGQGTLYTDWYVNEYLPIHMYNIIRQFLRNYNDINDIHKDKISVDIIDGKSVLHALRYYIKNEESFFNYRYIYLLRLVTEFFDKCKDLSEEDILKITTICVEKYKQEE